MSILLVYPDIMLELSMQCFQEILKIDLWIFCKILAWIVYWAVQQC